jgi:hypothetical protein
MLLALVTIISFTFSCKDKKENIEKHENTIEIIQNTQMEKKQTNNLFYRERIIINENENEYVITIGNITFKIPNDYISGYYDGIENKYINISDEKIIENITGSGFYKVFSILYFERNSDFEDPDHWGYGVKNLPVFDDYVNGFSEGKPKFFVSRMRRNKIKDINIIETLTLSRFEIFNKIFEHQIIFTDDKYFYCVGIQFWGSEFDKTMIIKMPEYFNLKDKNDNFYGSWIGDKRNEIYEKFIHYQYINDYINELFIETNYIFSNIIINN